MIRHDGDNEVRILRRDVEIVKLAQLTQDFYEFPTSGKYTLEFLTPTMFRQRGRYVILPDMRLIVQSLMMKYSAASDTTDMTDEDTLEQILEESFVTRHRLQSAVFSAEGRNFTGFVGNLTFCCRGTETMARYLRMLFTFGEFSGIGTKTAMGMGAMRFSVHDEKGVKKYER